MTEAEILLLMAKCVPVLLAVWIFVHLLCEEYLRALEARGLIRRVYPRVQTDDDRTSPSARPTPRAARHRPSPQDIR